MYENDVREQNLHTHSKAINLYTGSTIYENDTYEPRIYYTKKRWGTTTPSRPYTLTNEYRVERAFSKASSYTADTVNYPPYWDENTKSGTYLAVDLESALYWAQFTPELTDRCEAALIEAQNACFDQLAGQQWNVPVFLGELKKTTDFVSSFASAIDRGARYIGTAVANTRRTRRALARALGNFGKGYKAPPNASGGVAGLWLQWRYAVETGVMDIESAAKTTADLLLQNRYEGRTCEATRTNAFSLADVHRSDDEWGREIGLGLSLGAYQHHYLTRDCVFTAKAWFTAFQRNNYLTDANQLGLINAPAAIWELTALSFVADWIVDVGNFLERCTAGIGYEIRAGGVSRFRRIAGYHYVRTSTYMVLSKSFTSGDDPLYEASVYQRDPWDNPSPTWNPKFRMSTKRWIDAAALLRQIPLGRFRIF